MNTNLISLCYLGTLRESVLPLQKLGKLENVAKKVKNFFYMFEKLAENVKYSV